MTKTTLSIKFYDDLQRYPDVYENAQIYFSGIVKKIIRSDQTGYELILQPQDSTVDSDNDVIYVTGKQTSVRIIQGDTICCYGRYKGVQSYTIDGISYSIPTVDTYYSLFSDNSFSLPQKFAHSDIKDIASLIFGSGIEVRLPVDANEENDFTVHSGWSLDDSYIVELENQSNAKFSRFRFYTQMGYVVSVEKENSTINRSIEFMQDFEHFLVISYDYALSTAEIACYNNDLKRIWSREFENVVSDSSQIPYDFTKNNIYLATNNRIYVINAKTGEDTYSPIYIGQKTEIRKLKNGILAFSNESVDSVMLLDLRGNIIWTLTIPDCLGISGASSVQLIKNRIVAQTSFVRECDHIVVIDIETGKLILDCIPSIYY